MVGRRSGQKAYFQGLCHVSFRDVIPQGCKQPWKQVEKYQMVDLFVKRMVSGPVVWIPGIPLWKGLLLRGTPGRTGKIRWSRWWLNQPIWKIWKSNWKSSLNRGENKPILDTTTKWFVCETQKPWDLYSFSNIGEIPRHITLTLRKKKVQIQANHPFFGRK